MKKKTNNFEKFAKKKSNAAIKEQFKQEKRKWKKEREVAIDTRKKESRVRSQKSGVRSQESGVGSRESGVRDPKSQNKNYPQGPADKSQTELMPLNKFIAHCGVCGRRDAAELVKEGKVKVNGVLVTEPGHKVSGRDDINVNGKKITLTKNLVYILVNKPKDYITTTEDPEGRKTVLELIKNATRERVYSVGRLDRNTSGVLLFTNDGDLSQKLTHPSNEVKKIYAVTLDKPLTRDHFDQILKGVRLEDGMATVDVLAYTDLKDKREIGVELHGGRNRIVRRIFEHFGYDIKNLDRVVFAGLTKKNLQRGHWRFLSDKELRELKFFGKGK